MDKNSKKELSAGWNSYYMKGPGKRAGSKYIRKKAKQDIKKEKQE